MRNYLLSILFVIIGFYSNGQTVWNYTETGGCGYDAYAKCWVATEDFITTYPVFHIHDTSIFTMEVDTFKVSYLSKPSLFSPSSFIWTDSTGVFNSSPIDSLYIPEKLPDPTDSVKTRSFNSSYVVSNNRSFVSYSIRINSTLTLSGGQVGNVFLEVSRDDIDWYEIGRISNSNTGSLTIGLNISQSVTSQLSGYIPAGYYVRLRTSGSADVTYVLGNETYF